MSGKLRLLLVEDNTSDAELVIQTLKKGGYEVQYERVDNAEGVREAITQKPWHIVISDFAMPGFDGLAALSIVRETQLDVPFILVSGTVGEDRAVEAMKAGAQDYVMKGNLIRLAPAVKRELHEAQRRRDERKKELERQQTEEKLKQFKRFFSPQIADLIVTKQLEDPFKWHRKEISVLFFDLRGFTRMVEVSEAEKVMGFLQEYYSTIGKVAQKYAGTIGHVAGDGVMIFFNDPLDNPHHAQNAAMMALDCRELLLGLCISWNQNEHPLSFGAGIGSGYATIGGLGADGCWDYTAIGGITNLASRLCNEAKDGQIFVPQRFSALVKDVVEVEPLPPLTVKGIERPVPVFNILKLKING